MRHHLRLEYTNRIELFSLSRHIKFIFLVCFLTSITCFSAFSNPAFAIDDDDSPEGNLLQNRSFESGSLAPWAGYGTGSVTVQNCCAHLGSWSAKLTATNNYVEIYQPVNVQPNQRYRLIVWVYTNGTTARLGWYSNDGNDRDCASTNSTTYVKLMCEFIVPAGTVDFNVHLSIQPSGTKFAVVDAFKLVQICPNTSNYCYAQWFKQGNYRGVWAIIETADPAIREPQLSFTTIHVLNGNQWVEVGWIKEQASQCIPKFMWAIQPGNPHNYIPNVTPQIGTAYQYFLFRTGAGTWKFQVARLNGVVIVDQTISNSGLDGGQLAAGGEVYSPTHQNDMGVAGLLSLKYMNDQSQWFPWNGPSSTLEDKPYHVVETAPNDGNNIQIYGNNGNPVPPGAPCP